MGDCDGSSGPPLHLGEPLTWHPSWVLGGPWDGDCHPQFQATTTTYGRDGVSTLQYMSGPIEET